MIKIILLTFVLLNALGLMICDDPANQNTANPSVANAAINANLMMANGNLMVDANGNVIRDANGAPMMANGNSAMGANGNSVVSNSVQSNARYPPTGVNPGTTGRSSGTTGGNTAGNDVGNMAPDMTPRR